MGKTPLLLIVRHGDGRTFPEMTFCSRLWNTSERPTPRSNDPSFVMPRGVAIPELLRRACRALGLEVATIDYSVQANGELVLWEANSFCTMAPLERFILPDQRRFSERRCQVFEDIEGFFSGLVREANSGKERAVVSSD